MSRRRLNLNPIASPLTVCPYSSMKCCSNFLNSLSLSASLSLSTSLSLSLSLCLFLLFLADPVPGGCNMEFEVEVSPFLRLTSNSVENRLEFQLARLGWPRGSTRPLPSCASSLSFINYELYAYYLPADNYSIAELYHGTLLMSNIQTIITNGHRIVTPKTWSPKTRIELLSYPGRGIVLNVVAVFGHQRVPYVPISTYNCDFNPRRLDSCGKMNQMIAFLLLSINALIGLIICFNGNTLFTLQVLWSSFFTTFILSYILIAEYSRVDDVTRETWSAVAAIAVSLIWTLIYRVARVKHFSVLTSGLLLGFLMVSTILFTAVGNEDLFRSDFNYWIIIASVSGAVALLLLPFPTFMSMFASSIGGSYAFVFAIDRLIGSSLGYIVINILKRAAFKELSMATNEVPFQGKDICISIIWAILAFAGLFAQLYRYEGTTESNITEINGSSYMAFRVRVHRGRRSRSTHRSRSRGSRSRSRTSSRRSQSSGRSGRRSRSKGTRSAAALNAMVNPQVNSATNRATSPSDDVQPLVV